MSTLVSYAGTAMMKPPAEAAREWLLDNANATANMNPKIQAMIKSAWAEAQRQMGEAVLKAVDPGKSPCGCIIEDEYQGRKFLRVDCTCMNYDDSGKAHAWIESKNLLESIRALMEDK